MFLHRFSKVSEGLSESTNSCPPKRTKSPLQSPLWIFFFFLPETFGIWGSSLGFAQRCLKLNVCFYDHVHLNPWNCLPCHIFGTTACLMILTFPEQAGEAGKRRQVWEGSGFAVTTNINSSKKLVLPWKTTEAETHRPRAAGAGLALRNNQVSV